MSLIPFLAIAFGAGGLTLLTRRAPRLSIAIGLLGLAAALVAAFAIDPRDRLEVSGGALAASDFQRLFLILSTTSGLLLAIVGLAGVWQRNLAAAMLGGLGALGLGLALPDPLAGLPATVSAGIVGVLVALRVPAETAGVRSAGRELRTVGLAGAFAILAAALVAGPGGPIALSNETLGLAYLAMVVAVAVRFGAIPFHARLARLTETAPGTALPLLAAWAPAGFAAVALVWIDRWVSPLALPLPAERSLVVGIGLLCLLLGAVAATIQDDLEHVVGYSVVQDAGFVMLALAVLDISAWEPARTWLLIFVIVKSAFAGWAVAMRIAFGTTRLDELGGWLRRAPLLAVALAALVVATVGMPGLLVFDVRSRIADLALPAPLAIVAVLGGLASLAYYARIAWVGLGAPTALVTAYPGDRPRRPLASEPLAAGAVAAKTGIRSRTGRPEPSEAAPWAREAGREQDELGSQRPGAGSDGVADLTAAGENSETEATVSSPYEQATRRGRRAPRRSTRGGLMHRLALLESTWRLNRAPLAAALVLVLSLLGMAAAAGGFGIPEAARAEAPQPFGPGETFIPEPGATQPAEGRPPDVSPGAGASAAPASPELTSP